jgi:phosphoribosylformylglycinamidine (FGAM) synthase-like amidotransferase family enzyme
VLEEQVTIEGYEELAQAGASKEEIDEEMNKFLMNIEKQESDWEEDFIQEDQEDVEVSDDEGQIQISSDEEFEEESENEDVDM